MSQSHADIRSHAGSLYVYTLISMLYMVIIGTLDTSKFKKAGQSNKILSNFTRGALQMFVSIVPKTYFKVESLRNYNIAILSKGLSLISKVPPVPSNA